MVVMEHIAMIQLVGQVNKVEVMTLAGCYAVRFVLMVRDSTWFHCVWFTDKREEADSIRVNQEYSVEGNIRGNSYTDTDGKARQFYEVKVQNFTKI